MIGLLRGPVLLRTAEGEVIVDVAGVGYRVTVTPATAAALVAAGTGAEATLHVHTHVREDAIVLYGFVHDDERRCFEVLLGSHGVGPALALAIMAVLSPAALSTAVLEDDLDTLCSVPGVGRKTAARLLIELKSRLDLPDLSSVTVAARPARPAAAARTSRAEARAALSELGYAPRRDPRRARRPTRRCRGGRDAPPGAARAGQPVPMSPRARREVLAVDGDRATRPGPPTRATSRRPGIGWSTRRRPTPTRSSKRSVCGPAPSPSSSGSPSWSSTWRSCSRRPGSAASRSTTSCSPGRRAWARRRWPASWPPRWARDCASPPGPCSPGPATWPRCSPTCRTATSSSSTRSTACTVRSRRCSTPAMEDAKLDILIGKGPTARSIRLDLPRFTLVGATTRTGLVSGPLRDRFGFVGRLDLYDPADLRAIVRALGPDPRGAHRRGGGDPDRRALTGHAADRQPAAAPGARLRRGARRRRRSTGRRPARASTSSGSTSSGSTRWTGRSSTTLCSRFGGQPVGLTTLSQCVGEEPDTIEDAYEPFLLQTRADPADGAGPGGDAARLGPSGSGRAARRHRRNEDAAALLAAPEIRSWHAGSVFSARLRIDLLPLTSCTTRRKRGDQMAGMTTRTQLVLPAVRGAQGGKPRIAGPSLCPTRR